jgi:phospholipid N-methyltransferase
MMANSRVVFFREFLRRPRQVASLITSSSFLERRIVELAETRSAQTVVELGPGVGGTTRAILGAVSPGARLLSIEINRRFCGLLRRIEDARLTVHCGSAQDLRGILSQYRLPAPEVVISGIPFSTMDRDAGSRIVETVAAVLATGGRLVAYQVSNQVEDLARPLLGSPRVEVELLNIPPLRIYRWDKRLAPPLVPTDRRHSIHR